MQKKTKKPKRFKGKLSIRGPVLFFPECCFPEQFEQMKKIRSREEKAIENIDHRVKLAKK